MRDTQTITHTFTQTHINASAHKFFFPAFFFCFKFYVHEKRKTVSENLK